MCGHIIIRTVPETVIINHPCLFSWIAWDHYYQSPPFCLSSWIYHSSFYSWLTISKLSPTLDCSTSNNMWRIQSNRQQRRSSAVAITKNSSHKRSYKNGSHHIIQKFQVWNPVQNSLQRRYVFLKSFLIFCALSKLSNSNVKFWNLSH